MGHGIHTQQRRGEGWSDSHRLQLCNTINTISCFFFLFFWELPFFFFYTSTIEQKKKKKIGEDNMRRSPACGWSLSRKSIEVCDLRKTGGEVCDATISCVCLCRINVHPPPLQKAKKKNEDKQDQIQNGRPTQKRRRKKTGARSIRRFISVHFFFCYLPQTIWHALFFFFFFGWHPDGNFFSPFKK